MKRLMVATLLGVGIIASPLYAQQNPAEHADHHPPAAATKSPPADMAAHRQQMQANMQKMQALMGKIQTSKDSKEVESLLNEHMKMMREQMKSMHHMGPMMDKDAMGKGMMNHEGMKAGPKGEGPKGGAMMNEDMMRHHEHMMEHMQMMQGMMEQMMEHMDAEHRAMNASSAKK